MISFSVRATLRSRGYCATTSHTGGPEDGEPTVAQPATLWGLPASIGAPPASVIPVI